MGDVIVVDDERVFNFDTEDVTYCVSSGEALGVLSRLWIDQCLHYAPDLEALWLDHDLGGTDTIMVIIDYLWCLAHTDKPLKIHDIFVHSMNATAGDAILPMLDKFYRINRVPLPYNLVKTEKSGGIDDD